PLAGACAVLFHRTPVLARGDQGPLGTRGRGGRAHRVLHHAAAERPPERPPQLRARGSISHARYGRLGIDGFGRSAIGRSYHVASHVRDLSAHRACHGTAPSDAARGTEAASAGCPAETPEAEPMTPSARVRSLIVPLLAGLSACGEAQDQASILAISGGDPERGHGLIQSYGCGTCHIVEGVRGARGQVGPRL